MKTNHTIKSTILLLALLCIGIQYSYAQKKEVKSTSYTRSSLTMIIVEEEVMPYPEVILNTYNTSNFPDKFNDNNLSFTSINTDQYVVTPELREHFNKALESAEFSSKKQSLFKQLVDDALESLSLGGGKGSKMDYAVCAYEYFSEHNTAQEILEKWFLTKDENGNDVFSTALIEERGMYGASQEEIDLAKQSEMGVGRLADKGYELLNSSYVIFNRYFYIKQSDLIDAIDLVAKQLVAALGNDPVAAAALKAAVGIAKKAMAEGYYVSATSHLFKLKWDDSIQDQIFNVWGDVEKFRELNIGELQYVGNASSMANTKAGLFSNQSTEDGVRMATINATDAVIAKLEKKFDEFKTKTAIVVDPANKSITAQIGLKEGLESNDKYEVLEKVIKDDKIAYNRVGVIKVTKKNALIWDNRYMANEEPDNDTAELGKTEFSGFNKAYYTGMLIRQID